MQKISDYYNRTQRGFTLIEVIVSVSIFTLISVGAIALIANVITGGNKQIALLSDADQARKLGAKITQELRNSAPSNTGAYPLEQVSAQQIIFYSNVDGGTDIERVRYYISSGRLYRGIVKPTGSPLTYNVGTETVAVVQNDLANGTTPLFYYYDGSYTGVTDTYLAQPVSASSVRLVKLNLIVKNVGGQALTNTYTVTASASIRRIKDNLGD
jgi:prepilin-type N-terminal cleavage/methylation domain-containing protein